jgi:predicted metal-dependent hydrolase
MQVVHIKQKGRKTYSLQFDYTGTLIVKTGMNLFGSHVKQILKKHKNWISEQYETLMKVFRKIKHVSIENNSTIPIFATNTRIYISNLDTDEVKMEYNGVSIKITKPHNYSAGQLRIDFLDFLKEIARTYITKRVQFFANKNSFTFNKIFIRSQKTKWGSCSSLSNLSFNYQLIFAPKKVIDYVIVHELCHLRQMNHSKKFWDEVKKALPNYTEYKDWLHQNEYKVRVVL